MARVHELTAMIFQLYCCTYSIALVSDNCAIFADILCGKFSVYFFSCISQNLQQLQTFNTMLGIPGELSIWHRLGITKQEIPKH